MRHYLSLGLFISTIALGNINQSHAVAQTTTNSLEVATWPTNDWSFWPDDNDRAPKGTVSGASRDSCSNHEMTPLLPTSQYGFTRKSHPEILVATSVNTPRQALFSVQSDNGYYYETYIEFPDNPGIVSVSFPNEAPALVDNQLYQWSLIIMCNDEVRPDSPVLHGWIQLQPGESTDAANSLSQAVTYRDEHLWYDMIALLADLRRQEPDNQDVHHAWQSILAGADLESVADIPILE
ncbi:MAG: DUF928 domain-containing protein [Cyanobacteria bacterium P01_D01_bin.156]